MTHWLESNGARILAIVAVTLIVDWLVHRVVPRALRHAAPLSRTPDAVDDLSDALALAEQEKRRSTLTHVIVRTADVVLGLIAVLLVLDEVGISLAPLLAGAGIAGIALGFGAQAVVRDVLAGLFILSEGQYGQGDAVRVADITGVVERVNLRTTVLRDIDGIVHTIPNGEIRVSSNLTRSWSRVNINVSVGYGEDLDRVRAVLDAVGEELAADPAWRESLLEPPKVLRVDAFEDSGIAIKILGTTAPMKQWEVAGELRSRIKTAFDREGIEIPYPHRVVIVKDGRLPGEAAPDPDPERAGPERPA